MAELPHADVIKREPTTEPYLWHPVLPTLSTRPGNELGDQMFRSWRTLWRMVWQMHPEHPNATAYRATADAFRSGDREALANLIDADVVWHVPLFGDVRGRDRLVEWLGELVTHGFWLTEHDVFGNDEHLCALSVMGVKRPETDIQTRVVSVFHFREGKQLERWLYPEELEAWKQILPS